MKWVGLISLLGVWLAFSFVVVHGAMGYPGTAKAVEGQLLARAEEQLAVARIEWTQVEVDGRQLALFGEAVSEDERSRAQTVANSWGCGRMLRSDESEPEHCVSVKGVSLMEPRHYDLEFEAIREDLAGEPSLVLRGSVPTEELRIETYNHAVLQFGTEQVIDEREVVFGLFHPGLVEVQRYGIDALAELLSGTFFVVEGSVALSGAAPGDEVLEEVRDGHAQFRIQEFARRSIDVEVPDVVARANACEADLDALMARAKIRFSSGGSDIIGADAVDDVPLLEKLSTASADCPRALIEVSGHTDDVGNEQSNRELSELRAASVIEALTRFGANSAQFVPVGHGEDRPLENNDSRNGRAQNRRIEFNVLHPNGVDL